MAHLTADFTSEAPLASSVREAISTALADGWADPKKLSQASHRAAALRNSAIESLATSFGFSPDDLQILGEPNLAFELAISGFIEAGQLLTTSSVDQGKIRAVARSYKGPTHLITVDSTGALLPQSLPLETTLAVLQLCNGETGATQEISTIREQLPQGSRIIVDATHAVPSQSALSSSDISLFDSRSWNGPSGIAFIATRDWSKYRYPLAHIAPIKSPGSYSIPLLVGAAIALDEYRANAHEVKSLRKYAIDALNKLERVDVIAAHRGDASPYLSLIIDGFAAEEVLRSLLPHGVICDAGSACSPEDLAPSHVIAAMGFPTTGHLRVTIHPHHTRTDIDLLAQTLSSVLAYL